MSPVDFPQSTTTFGAPPGLAESQVATVPAFMGTVQRGSMEGSTVVVTAWQPDAADLVRLNQGHPVFLTFLGGLPAHMASMDFETATQPA